ncbi:MAG: 2-hydroxyacyl-CoA dehydratase family protein [Planctomycetaceae bacterium]|nr:2-hydroxyacyl-CoA dehydratase family protein [Planctomycetaceae bacterium]
MKTVYYTCPFVPKELIAACGLLPMRSVPALQADIRIEGMCSYAAAWLEELEQRVDSGEDFIAVFSTACDQMRRAFDLYHQSEQSSFLLNVPSMTTENSFRYYVQELRRLEQFLCSISGETPDWRRNCRQTANKVELTRPNKAIAITGGPLNSMIYKSIERLLSEGAAGVVFDATEGALTPELVGIDAAGENDPLEAIARIYFELPAIWRRPNNSYYQWMAQACNAAGADAIILVRHVFCDLWHGQGPELSKRLSVPVLELNVDGQGELPVAAVSRIEAFLEALG